MPYDIRDDEELALLISYLECRTFIEAGRDRFDYIGDLILPARSVLELIREDVAEKYGMSQATDLDRDLQAFDSYVRARAQLFNEFFAVEHAFGRRAQNLEGWINDENGGTPEVPPSHWWWRPLEEE